MASINLVPRKYWSKFWIPKNIAKSSRSITEYLVSADLSVDAADADHAAREVRRAARLNYVSVALSLYSLDRLHSQTYPSIYNLFNDFSLYKLTSTSA